MTARKLDRPVRWDAADRYYYCSNLLKFWYITHYTLSSHAYKLHAIIVDAGERRVASGDDAVYDIAVHGQQYKWCLTRQVS